MLKKSFEEMGIQPGYGFKQLLYSAVANALVVQAESARNVWRPERLYFRTLSADRYEPVGEPADLVSQEYPVVAPSRPLLAYNTFLHRFDVDEQGKERHFGNWDSVRIFDLRARAEVCAIYVETAHFPSGVGRAWISRLLSFTESGKALHVVAGLFQEGGILVEHRLAELDLQTLEVKPLALLPAVFM